MISCFTWVVWKKIVGGHGQQQEPITTSQRLNLLYILEAAVRRWCVVMLWKFGRKIRGFLCVLSQQAFPSQKTLHLHWFWYDLGGSFQGTPLLRGNHLWLKCFEACRWWGAHMPTQWERYGSDKDEWGRGERDSQLYQLGQFHGFQNFQSWDLIILEIGSFSIRIFVLLYQKDLKIFEAKIRLQV